MDTSERVRGLWNGVEKSFKRVHRGHRFTDEECLSLLAGETIDVHDFVGKNGKYGGRIVLEDNLEYNGTTYFGPNLVCFLNAPGIPKTWCKHTFTSNEKQMLEDGFEIYAEDFIGRSGKIFSAYLSYSKDENKLIPRFENS